MNRLVSQKSIKPASAMRPGKRARNAARVPTSPASGTHELQRTLGNRAVQHLLQARLTVSQPGDVYEEEADRVADEVMRMPDPVAAPPRVDEPPPSARIQRMCTGCEEEIQRDTALEEEDVEEQPLMRTEGGSADLDERAGEIEPYLSGLSGRGQSLPESTRAFMEPRFGADFSGVRVHTDGDAAQSAHAVDALAFTVGRDIVFGAGSYAPESESGRKLLAHELTHVIQQGEGREPDEFSAKLYRQPPPAAPAPAAPAPAPAAPAPAPAAPAPAAAATSDALLNEWLAEHSGEHLSADLTWILSQWPEGGSLNDLNADFRDDVQGLLTFAAATPGASFTIISYARSAEKQHMMHVGQYIRKSWIGYNDYKFSLWPDVTAAGGRAAVQALTGAERKSKLQGIANPEVLDVVWDTGTASSSKTDGSAVAAAYDVGVNNPVANGGPTYSWPTGKTSTSLHGSGNAVDVDPIALPNQVTIRSNQARAWPDLAAAQGAFGAANVAEVAATATDPAGYTISGLNNVARRDAFFELFFEVRSAARAGFVDLPHFQAP